MKKNINIGERIARLSVIYAVLALGLLILSIDFFIVHTNIFNGILTLLITVVVVIVFYYSYYHVYKVVRQMDQNLRKYNKGNNLEALKDTSSYFTEENKQMIIKTLTQLENIQNIKISNLHSEYRALQNQINPHFLYNTLEAIRSDALVAGVSDIADITESLATFFRYTISNYSNKVTLEDELSNVENYFKIQQYRFGEKIKLDLVYDDESKLLKHMIPKLTLQPIVENAIIHGLEKKVGSGRIRIHIHETQHRITIDIVDDGVGIKEEALDKINKNMSESISETHHTKQLNKGGIALINVNKRIKLTFGEPYGIRVSSVENYGTTVQLTLPK